MRPSDVPLGTRTPTLPSSVGTESVVPNANSWKLTGTVTQTGVDEDFSTVVPVEIQVARGKSITHWVHTGSTPATFSVALQVPPLKVTLDPHQAVLRK